MRHSYIKSHSNAKIDLTSSLPVSKTLLTRYKVEMLVSTGGRNCDKSEFVAEIPVGVTFPNFLFGFFAFVFDFILY